MTPEATARATAQAIGDLGGGYMLDGATYAKGAELGFSGVDFYVLGRGGVLGDTTAEVVAAAFIFWNPDQVATQWELGRKAMAPGAAAREWVEVCHAYGEANLPDLDGLERLGDLCLKVTEAASPACAPLFAGWRAVHEVPGPDRPKARVQHLLNALRELRGGLHGGAVLASGLSPVDAVAFRAPGMSPVFGWDPEALPDATTVEERWRIAEAGTDAAMGRVLSVLDEAERAELSELANALHAAWQDR